MRRHGVIVSLTASTNHAAISVSVLFVTVEMLTSMTIHVFILPFSFCYSNAVSAFFVKLASANLNAGDGRVSPQTISKISCFAFSLKNSATMEPSFIIICHDISSAAIHFLFPPHLFYRVGWMLSKIRTPASLPSGIALTGDVYRLKESSYLSQPVYRLCKGFPPVTIYYHTLAYLSTTFYNFLITFLFRWLLEPVKPTRFAIIRRLVAVSSWRATADISIHKVSKLIIRHSPDFLCVSHMYTVHASPRC